MSGVVIAAFAIGSLFGTLVTFALLIVLGGKDKRIAALTELLNDVMGSHRR